ncbi:hypothetical protein V494_02553, partial [Pseudogymnoascus sp. VKM F-4513 (FW-928)]
MSTPDPADPDGAEIAVQEPESGSGGGGDDDGCDWLFLEGEGCVCGECGGAEERAGEGEGEGEGGGVAAGNGAGEGEGTGT